MEKSFEVLPNGGSRRKDRGRRHAGRGSVLSRSLIQALEQRGENIRALKKIESELRADLKPQGALGRFLFDRFWASVLRLILVTRLEEGGLASQRTAAKRPVSMPSLQEGPIPILLLPDADDAVENPENNGEFDSEVFRRLALIARYDRSAAKEMYRCMGLLLIMQSDGRAGLEAWVRATVGLKNEIGENKNG